MTISEDFLLTDRNTFGIAAKARYFVEYSNETELIELLNNPILKNKTIFHIGGGSNLLFTKDFDGAILHSQIKGFQILKQNEEFTHLRVGAGEIWDSVVDFCVKNNLYGSENLSLIPGEIGAAAVQNIGAYGVEIKDIIASVETIEIATGFKKVFQVSDCKYAYRDSIFKNELKNKSIITHVTLKLANKEHFELSYGNLNDLLQNLEPNLAIVRNTIIKIRESKLPDPRKIGNAGSFFMNPYLSIEHYNKLKTTYPDMPHYPVSENSVKVPAAWLIEQCGWKGRSFGNAAVHDKQSLVLVNKGNAKASEIIELSNQIIESVNRKFEIRLIPEVIFI